MPTKNRTSTSSDSSPPERQRDTSSSEDQHSGSRHSATFSDGDISTLPTSLSNSLLYQLDFEERISLPPPELGDEYFYADGKQPGYQPDTGRGAIKSESMIMNDLQSIASSTSFDRGLPASTSISHIVGARDFHDQGSLLDSRCRRERNSSDSTDDCFATYSMFQRHYCS